MKYSPQIASGNGHVPIDKNHALREFTAPGNIYSSFSGILRVAMLQTADPPSPFLLTRLQFFFKGVYSNFTNKWNFSTSPFGLGYKLRLLFFPETSPSPLSSFP